MAGIHPKVDDKVFSFAPLHPKSSSQYSMGRIIALKVQESWVCSEKVCQSCTWLELENYSHDRYPEYKTVSHCRGDGDGDGSANLYSSDRFGTCSN